MGARSKSLYEPSRDGSPYVVRASNGRATLRGATNWRAHWRVTAADATTTPKLFVRQSSGLVRNVSVTNALFFNVAAFVGVGLTLYPIFYSLAFVPVWTYAGLSSYAWAAIITGLFCVLLALIFASLTSVMPRS